MNMMPLTTSSADQSEVATHITIHNVIEGAAFAIAEHDGGQVFVPRGMRMMYENLEPGARFRATLVPNRAKPEQTPWFALIMVPEDDTGPLTAETVLRLMRETGGVWTPAEVAEELGGPKASAGRAAALLESLYMTGAIDKFAHLRSGQGKPVRLWYSAYPDDADVSEWEEE